MNFTVRLFSVQTPILCFYWVFFKYYVLVVIKAAKLGHRYPVPTCLKNENILSLAKQTFFTTEMEMGVSKLDRVQKL